MSVFDRFRGRGDWDLEAVTPPWGDRPSIYAHVAEHVSPDVVGLTEGGDRLPDETDDGGIQWVAGGLDGAFGHHGGGGGDEQQLERLYDALRALLGRAGDAEAAAFYEAVVDGSALEYVDVLLERIVQDEDLDPERLERIGHWLTTRAADREAVKVGLAILGLYEGDDYRDLFMTIGRHEELTLYAAVALSNSLIEPEPTLWELAKQVEGWGRIALVERLEDTEDDAIRAWMLRDGYRNSIMYEYLAYRCATGGGLREALEEDEVDDALLAGAGDILRALINGGPAEDMDDYADGAEATRLYLHHLAPRASRLEELLVVDSIARFLDADDADWDEREALGWSPETRAELSEQCAAIAGDPRWRERVEAGLASGDDGEFFLADEAARVLGIDTWHHHLERARGGDDTSWFYLGQTDDPARMKVAIELAERTLPLDEIASGPAEELGLGPAWRDHGMLDALVQHLGQFPGLGWPLIRAALRSPVVRNRNLALQALAAWPRADWPGDAEATLREALAAEPSNDVRAAIERVLAGDAGDD